MSTISKLIQGIDSSGDLAEVQKQAISTLGDLGNAKCEYFYQLIMNSIEGEGADKTIPVSSIVSYSKYVHGFTSDSSKDISGTITNALTDFVSGSTESIIAGASCLIDKVITVLLGESSSEVDEIQKYYCLREGMSLIRIDMHAWYQNVTASSLKEKIEKIVAVCLVKSVVDMSKIDFNTFLYFYQDVLKETMTHEQQQAEIEAVKNIYNEFIKTNSLQNIK